MDDVILGRFECAGCTGEGAETPMDLDSEEEAEPVQTNVATTSQSHHTSGSDTPFTYFAHLKEKFRPELGSVVVGGTVKVFVILQTPCIL